MSGIFKGGGYNATG